jgi:primosomal protein N' (replication factor Y)
VFVQTRAPGHHAIQAAAAHSVSQFAAAELPLRSPPQPPYPPRTGLVRFVVATTDHARTADLAEKVAGWLRRASRERLDDQLIVLGPAPCPLMRLKGKWRWHVLAKSAEPRVLGRVVRAWRARSHRAVLVDRDPQTLL